MPTSDWIKYRAYLKGQASPLVLQKKGPRPWGKFNPNITYDKVPAWILVTAVVQMARDGWTYPTKKEFVELKIACAWGKVDCISVARFVGIHFKVTGWQNFDTTTDNILPGDLIPIDVDDQIPEGAGVAHSKNGHVDHLGVYVGAVYVDGVFYTHGVVSSPSFGERVHTTELDTAYWTDMYMYKYVDYSNN